MKRSPLTADSLLTRSQVAAELQIGEGALARILARVRPRRVGEGARAKRWLWGEVLSALPADGEEPVRRTRASRRRVVEL